jgi:hypothetical protein
MSKFTFLIGFKHYEYKIIISYCITFEFFTKKKNSVTLKVTKNVNNLNCYRTVIKTYVILH